MKKFFTRLSLVLALLAGASTMQAAEPETLVVDGSKVYLWKLTQGADYVLPGTDETWYAQPDFFTRNTDGTWKFNAYGDADYGYKITLNEDLKYIDVALVNGDDPDGGNANYEINKAVYVIGSGNIGFPSYETNQINWTESQATPVPQIKEGVYRLQLTVGKELAAGTNYNFKFFEQKGWGNEFVTSNTYMVPNDYLYFGTQDGNSGDNGNIYGYSGKSADKDKFIVTLDCNKSPYEVTVEYVEYVPADFPTFNGTNMTKQGSYYTYEGTLTQGEEFTLANLDVVDMDAATLYVDEIAATKTGEGTYKFNAVSGNYTVILMPSLNYAKIFAGTYDEPATYANGKALWIIGSNIGQPTTAANNSNWGASLANSIPVAQISDNIYKVALTVGKEVTSSINLKFFGQYGWGTEFRHFDLMMADNDYLYLNAPEGSFGYDDDGNDTYNYGDDDGNIFGLGSLSTGDKLILTVDLNDYEAHVIDYINYDVISKPGKVTVEYEAYAGPVPTINGEKMTGIDGGYKFVGNLEQGGSIVIGGDLTEVTDLVKSDDFFYNYDYLTKTGDTSFKFNAVSGKYAIELDQDKKYFRIYPVQADGSAGNFTEEGGYATWVCGNNGIGFPSYATNMNNWGEANGWAQALNISISPAQIAEKIYRLTVTVGKQVTADAVFKFYDSYNYTITDGRESDVAADFIDLLDENIVYSGNDLAFNGLEDGATYVVIINRTGERSTIKAEKATDETGAGVELPTSVKGVEVQAEKGDNAIYTLSGVRVAAPQKGVYIQNGKKFVVK